MISCCKLASLSLSIGSSSEPVKLPIKFNYSPNGVHLDLMSSQVYCIPPRSLRRKTINLEDVCLLSTKNVVEGNVGHHHF